MNGYKAFYKGKTIEVEAESSCAAQKVAAAKFIRWPNVRFWLIADVSNGTALRLLWGAKQTS